MDRQGKAKLKEELAGAFEKSSALIIAEYRGMTVEEMTALRRELRKANADFRILKNRVAKKAIEGDVPDMGVIKDQLRGPIGVVCAYGDVAAATKATLDFEKDHPNLVVKGGYMEKAGMSPDQLKALASLPSKEVLLGQIVGSLVAPHRGILGVLNGVQRQLVTVISAIRDKKSA